MTLDRREANEIVDEDWEEWDGRSPFWAHCVAGSFAGVMEHVAIYPLDTVRTHIQVCAACIQRGSSSSSSISSSSKFAESASSNLVRSSAMNQQRLPLGMWQTIRYLVSEPVAITAAAESSAAPSSAFTSSTKPLTTAGWTRLFRGVQTILIGCIPAHALYFSSYEMVKGAFITKDGELSTIGSSLAGAAAVTAHDLVMTPLDTLKQRLQIGHYNGVMQAFQAVYKQEGVIALYRSFPITLASNIPYGMVMVSTQEACKHAMKDVDQPQWKTVLIASSVAGFVAAAVTTPLDRIKTALQTQKLQPCLRGNGAANCVVRGVHYTCWHHAARRIMKNEGAAGFFRGVTPRVLSHTPAVAISWTTYETAKQYLLSQYY